MFPYKNIIPKQHYFIHIPGMIKLLGPMIQAAHQQISILNKPPVNKILRIYHCPWLNDTNY